MVFETASASGTCRNCKSGMNGMPKISKICVLFESTSASVPMHMTTGSTPNHMPAEFFTPFSRNWMGPRCSSTRCIARSRPYWTEDV